MDPNATPQKQRIQKMDYKDTKIPLCLSVSVWSLIPASLPFIFLFFSCISVFFILAHLWSSLAGSDFNLHHASVQEIIKTDPRLGDPYSGSMKRVCKSQAWVRCLPWPNIYLEVKDIEIQ